MKKTNRLAKWGQVVCQITGDEPLRFLNICRDKKITLYGVKKQDDTYICSMSVKDYFQVRMIRRVAGVHIRITHRKGIPFLLQRAQKRAVFFMGMIGFVVLLLLCYGYVWDIRISGNHKISDETLLRYLKTKEICCGMPKKAADPHRIAADLRDAFPEFSWVSVEKTGTILEIRVQEARKSEGRYESNKEGSLYADKEGRITSLVTRSGVCMVKEGDQIYPGDLLVTGEIPIKDDGGNVIQYDYCSADADILLDTARVYYDRVEYKHRKRTYGETKISGIQFGFGDSLLQINAADAQGDVSFDSYRFRLSEAFVLPVTLGICHVQPYTEDNALYTPQEAADILQEHFSEFFVQLRKNVMRITDNNVKIVLYKEHAVAYGIVHVQEQTGVLAEIEKSVIEKSVIETERNDS